MPQDQQPQQQPAPTKPARAAVPTEPVAESTPYQQQPVSQQYFAQPQAAPVQYVVMAESLKGVKGWLMALVILFAISALAYIGTFFASFNFLDKPFGIVALLFSPILCGLAVASVVFITMQKKLGKWIAIGFLSTAAVYSLISSIILGSSDVATLMSGIVSSLLVTGFAILYFLVSKRVKETLVG